MRQPSATHRSSCQDTWALRDAGRRPLKPWKLKGHEGLSLLPTYSVAADRNIVGLISKNRKLHVRVTRHCSLYASKISDHE